MYIRLRGPTFDKSDGRTAPPGEVGGGGQTIVLPSGRNLVVTTTPADESSRRAFDCAIPIALGVSNSGLALGDLFVPQQIKLSQYHPALWDLYLQDPVARAMLIGRAERHQMIEDWEAREEIRRALRDAGFKQMV